MRVPGVYFCTLLAGAMLLAACSRPLVSETSPGTSEDSRISFFDANIRPLNLLEYYEWLSRSHSNALVPLYARGVGSERFASLAASEDPFYGTYADHTDVFEVMRTALAP